MLMGDVVDIATYLRTSCQLISCRLSVRQSLQSGQQASDFFGGVVMGQADAKEAAVFFHVEAFGKIQGVVIPVPGEEAAVAQAGGEFQRSVVRDAHGESRTAAGQALRDR